MNISCFLDPHTKIKSTMSNFILLITVALSWFPIERAAGAVICKNPIQIGELRVMNSRRCVNIQGTSGKGNVNTHHCDGCDDQQLILCGDGTIRNTQSPHNCLTEFRIGRARNVKSVSCQVYPAIPNSQKWRLGRSKTFVDKGGIKQKAREIINVRSGRYLDVRGTDGRGNIGTFYRDGYDDQLFYFRSRGKLVDHGKLQNQKSGLCLDVSGSSGGIGKNVLIGKCGNLLDQYFLLYENGELINKKSGLCVNIGGYDGHGNIGMHPCQDLPDQMWSRPHQYCHGDYCSFVSKKSGNCLNPVGTDARKGRNIQANRCDARPDQRFRFVNEKWVMPTITWSQVGCNENGKVTHTITNTVSYKKTITSNISSKVSSTILAGTKFASAPVSVNVADSLAKTWEESQSETKSTTFTCENYGSGKLFTWGCMWQVKLTTRQAINNDLLIWKPKIVKCTSNNHAPNCPPFTRCKDKTCTMCEDWPGDRNKRSLDGSLLWETVLKIE